MLRTYSKEMAELSESESEGVPEPEEVAQPVAKVAQSEEEAAPDEAKAQPKPAEVAQRLVQVAVAVEHYP